MSVSFEEANSAIEARLGHKAAKHCRRVAEAAAALALEYGVDAQAARLAGLLHDWDREQTPEALLEAARAAGIEITDADAATPHLLHSRTGAVAVRSALPGIPDEVVIAISRHTLGAEKMSALDRVVYLADMIESHRDYPGVEELRAAAGRVSLAELFALGYQQSMLHIIDARKSIHPLTVAVWNANVAGQAR